MLIGIVVAIILIIICTIGIAFADTENGANAPIRILLTIMLMFLTFLVAVVSQQNKMREYGAKEFYMHPDHFEIKINGYYQDTNFIVEDTTIKYKDQFKN